MMFIIYCPVRGVIFAAYSRACNWHSHHPTSSPQRLWTAIEASSRPMRLLPQPLLHQPLLLLLLLLRLQTMVTPSRWTWMRQA